MGASLIFPILGTIIAVGVLVVVIVLILRRSEPSVEEQVKQLVQQGKVDLAAQLLVTHERHQEAVQLYLQNRKPRQAAQLYAHQGDYRRAAQMFADLKDYDAAANAYLKSGDRSAAASLYLKAGMFEPAASLLMEAGKLDEAASVYLKAGNLMKAAAAYQDVGQKKKAAAVLGAHHMQLGEFPRAGKYFLTSGQFRQAGDAFMRGNQPEMAAKAYESVGEFTAAARARLQMGDVVKAAEHLERLGNTKEAIRLFESAGKWNKVVECHKRDRNWLALGNLMMRLSKNDLAVEFFKRLSPLDAGYIEAALSLASILEEQGDHAGARKKYREVLEFHGVNAHTSPALFSWCKLCESTNSPQDVLPYLRDFSGSGPVAEKARNWRERLEHLVITSAQTMVRGLDVSEDGADPTRTSDGGLVLPSRSSIAERYEIVEKIGHGGHGVIYKAQDRVLGRTVVLKFLFRNQVPSELARTYFLREAKTTASLNHPNIVTLYDMGQVGEDLYIAMEYIQGVSLEDHIRKLARPMPLARTMDIVSQVAEALQYAHQRQIIHRDIKPGNVMLTGEENLQVKLMDFGLAKALDENPHKTLIICGTPLYMSPEQIVGDFVDHLSDLYSLAVMVFQLLTGKTPFPTANILAHHQFTAPPHPTTLFHEIPVEVGDVVLKGMEKKRSDRYQSAQAFMQDLMLAAERAEGAAGDREAAATIIMGLDS